MEKSVAAVVEKMGHVDALYCIRLNRWIRDSHLHRFFSTISRLGDGIFWYGLMLLFPVFMGAEGFVITALMILMAAWGVYIYRYIKKRSMRPRPFVSHRCIRQGARTLDCYSFPSGHTMHAVAFTILLTYAVPGLGLLLLPFALLTALARVVLGLHYPSDVFMGAVLGMVNGTVMLSLFGTFLQ
ncbi:MAG: phosphatase PAP2 family protein [Pseudomonadales bacterium]|uniref:phosphatase PAP2 family protein n=1 Tax=unclassified Ketobacter TaxID=2639109 RepID=UPI000C5BC723|nr:MULTISPECIES: phosphatase PAP2 family protein [unclassified Ketobacter]MAQ25625.1 phosphatase PAP2 family protein [Pseudomonadales bacterium]HAG96128.1 phosphatase PAP2 family protein [Gammaproteobacteria bacterium]MBI25673.1 phosphatase PAP2 family protein [Pseudomonadales bacterium]RLT91157.1 MAG: phosphatase PAP2 family protein [Ketobacter sp. GenoA1]RLT98408.1 MAG: phosphatase PAP2 family protein [Ketobacter sp.]|tara:strand:+ start:1423 stop:1974 length:552 start_codon:yes stop_codon:yes gene_type:complete